MLIDLHTHTDLSSCGRMSPRELVRAAKEAGLDGVAITDHDVVKAHRFLSEGRQENGIYVFFGLEYATVQGDFLVFVPDYDKLPAGLDGPNLLKLVDELGGAAILAHPGRKARPGDRDLILSGQLPIIEAVNGRNSEAENALSEKLGCRGGSFFTAGSDSHTVEELGGPATCFDSNHIHTRSDLMAALKSGQYSPQTTPLTRAA